MENSNSSVPRIITSSSMRQYQANEYVSSSGITNNANHQIYMDPTTTSKQQQMYQQQLQQQQVQILPQDDNWGENTTAHGDFSDFNDDMTEDGRSSYFNPRYPSNSNETNKYNVNHFQGGSV